MSELKLDDDEINVDARIPIKWRIKKQDFPDIGSNKIDRKLIPYFSQLLKKPSPREVHEKIMQGSVGRLILAFRNKPGKNTQIAGTPLGFHLKKSESNNFFKTSFL